MIIKKPEITDKQDKLLKKLIAEKIPESVLIEIGLTISTLSVDDKKEWGLEDDR